MVRYHTFYYDPRGSWREWDTYKTLAEAKKGVPDSEWFIEERTSFIIAESKNAKKYGEIICERKKEST